MLPKTRPSEIFNLAEQSSVSFSSEQLAETLESISTGTLYSLEGIRFLDRSIRLYSIGTSKCFGNTGQKPADENTPFRPRSPHAVAKSCAVNLVANYREAYKLFACTNHLFDHESPLRPQRFVTLKIVAAAYRIKVGLEPHVTFSNLDIARDWGWAPDYVSSMWLLLQRESQLDVLLLKSVLYLCSILLGELLPTMILTGKSIFFSISHSLGYQTSPTVRLTSLWQRLNWVGLQVTQLTIVLCNMCKAESEQSGQ